MKRMWLARCLTMVLVVFLAGVTEGQSPKTVAVLNFEVNSPQGQLNYLSKGLADMLIARLVPTRRLSVVERSRLDDALSEAGLAASGIVEERSAVKLGKALGANFVLLGTLTSFGTVLSLDIRVVDVESGKIEGTASERGKDLDALPDMLDRLCARVMLLLLSYSVSGRVTSAVDGRGIAGATVSFTGSALPVTTGTEGEWAKEELTERTVVTVSKDGWAFSPPSRTVTGSATGVDFVGTPMLYAVSGRVTSPSGAGVGGITIAFSGDYGSALTTPDGSYAKSGLQGTVTVKPVAEGWSFTPPSRQVAGASDGVDFLAVPPPYVVSGRVTDEEGKGLEGVKVVVAGGASQETTTDARGMWVVREVVGAATVAAEKEGWVFTPPSRQVTGPAGDVSFLGRYLSYSISGRVTDARGNPIDGVVLRLTGDLISGTGAYETAITDAGGYWSKSGLRGTVTVTPTEDNWAFEPRARSVSGPDVSLNLTGSPVRRRRIAFESYRFGQLDIYTINPDGSDEMRLTYDSADDGAPSWSPDGKKIAFHSDRGDGRDSIFVMNADGSDARPLTISVKSDSHPVWSPDGSKIAFESDRDGDMDIFVLDINTRSVTRLCSHPEYDLLPSWSPDGRKIAFQSYRDGNYEIYVMNADGTGQARLTRNTARDTHPSWSPDGSRIAFVSERDGNPEIYVMRADGTGQTRLTYNTERDESPCWSSDGSQIAFASFRDGNYEIYVMNADGTAPTRVTRNSNYDGEPSW